MSAASPESQQLVERGKAAVRAGDTASAQRFLAQAVRRDPSNEQAWLWLAGVVREPAARRECFERVLALNAGNVMAQKGLAALGGPAPTLSAAPASSSVPATSAAPSAPAVATSATVRLPDPEAVVPAPVAAETAPAVGSTVRFAEATADSVIGAAVAGDAAATTAGAGPLGVAAAKRRRQRLLIGVALVLLLALSLAVGALVAQYLASPPTPPQSRTPSSNQPVMAAWAAPLA